MPCFKNQISIKTNIFNMFYLKTTYQKMVKTKDTQFCGKNLKIKKKKKIDLPERGFELQIFSNFSAHFLSFHGRWSSNLDKEVKNSWLYLVCQFGPNFGQTNTNVLSFHFIKSFIQLKSLVFEKHRKMLMIAILLLLLFKSHMF